MSALDQPARDLAREALHRIDSHERAVEIVLSKEGVLSDDLRDIAAEIVL